MKIDRDLNSLFQGCNKLSCLIWKKKTGHIFDTDRVCTHFLDTFRNACPVLKSISITKCIGKSNLCMAMLFVCSMYSSLKVTKVVHTVENTDDIDTICQRFLNKILYNIISVWTVSKNVLATEKHLQLCVLESCT